MSYSAIARMVTDTDLQMRITACAAQEGIIQPERWSEAKRWDLAVTPGWAAAYASALANPEIERPGDDPGVITDGMILSAVQPLVSSSQSTL